jgi:hypothetical protein
MAGNREDMRYDGPGQGHGQDTSDDYLRIPKSTASRFGLAGIICLLMIAVGIALVWLGNSYLQSELEACRAGIEILKE